MMKGSTNSMFCFMFATLLVAGCCHQRKLDYEPSLPKDVTGWKYREENGVGIVGDFVLKKGEHTNNGEVEIRVADLIAADACADQGTSLAHKRVKLQFIRMSDKKMVCEQTLPEVSGGNLCGSALDEFWINNIGIREINIKDQWVHFILTGAEKEPQNQRKSGR